VQVEGGGGGVEGRGEGRRGGWGTAGVRAACGVRRAAQASRRGEWGGEGLEARAWSGGWAWGGGGAALHDGFVGFTRVAPRSTLHAAPVGKGPGRP
jgi:hypothetical protein